MIVRYSTPTVSIDMENDMSEFDRVKITLRQVNVKITKDATVNGTRISIPLTQEETALFAQNLGGVAQVNAWKGNKRIPSDIMTFETLENLLDEVIE